MKEPPRGQFEKDDVLGEVIEDEKPAPISMEAAFARIKKIAHDPHGARRRSARSGFGLFSQAALASLYLNDNLHVHDVLDAGPHPQPLGHRGAADPAVRRAVLRPRCTG